ncbi:hypothetical protein J6590_003869 [Homalodisca vitripennis]|nr:hypothetical protein J6590_003869 [Homalodisca vitripennis]
MKRGSPKTVRGPKASNRAERSASIQEPRNKSTGQSVPATFDMIHYLIPRALKAYLACSQWQVRLSTTSSCRHLPTFQSRGPFAFKANQNGFPAFCGRQRGSNVECW